MTKPIIAIVFGGASTENKESIRAAHILYRYAIQRKLEHRYEFHYFYLTPSNQWTSETISNQLITGALKENDDDFRIHPKRILELYHVNAIYNMMMGTSGENGNIMGTADLLHVPMIGCGIKASSIALDKYLSKLLVQSLGVQVVDYIRISRYQRPSTVVDLVTETIGFPCFVKPTNLGTCSFVFKAETKSQFLQEWKRVTQKNNHSEEYLIEKYIDGVEVRVFMYENPDKRMIVNDEYVTTLKLNALQEGGSLFNHVENNLPTQIRHTIRKYSKRIFSRFGMKDYARIDFFVDLKANQIYFNEANTQPFISSFNIELLRKTGVSYARWLHWMIQHNLQ